MPALRRVRRATARLLGRCPSEENAASLARSEQDYRLLAENASDIIWRLELPARLTYVSPACERILGWTPEEQLARRGSISMLTPESAAQVGPLLQTAIDAGLSELTYDAEHRKKDGGSIWCEVHITILRDADGRAFGCVGVTRDVSERRALQDRLRQSQKMEALGSLAGGVAHDFNNYLTVILSYLDAIAEEIPKTHPHAELVVEARTAADRSAALARQLLAFSRRQPMQRRVFDLNGLVCRSKSLIQRLVGEHVRLETRLEGGRLPVRADPNQIEQALMNLAVNARDAIGSAGTITLETARVVLDPETAFRRGGLVPGPYAVLAVVDDGVGIDPEIAERVFEPFFSTKERRGTGLGLATVYGITKQCGGYVELRSEPGRGTDARIHLPLVEEPEERGALESEPVERIVTGDETVLLVEDDDLVRRAARKLLERGGYRVLEAGGAEEALELLKRPGDPPQLLLTDLLLPGESGPRLVERVRARFPGIRVVFMSGYAEEQLPRPLEGHLVGPLVRKPFHQRELLAAVRQALDADDGNGAR